MSMDEKQLPDASGFMFHPTDEELVGYYLKRKLSGKKLPSVVIPEVDVYKFAPWDLPDMAGWKGEHQSKWHFFCPSSKYHHSSSGRANRATDVGYWKTTSKERAVSCKDGVVGMRKTLVFYRGRPPSGERTDWIMHEYRIDEQVSSVKDHEFVLCVIFRKDGTCPKTSLRMMEEAIIDDDDNDNDDGFFSPHNSLEPDQSETRMQLASEIEPVILDTGTSWQDPYTDVGGSRFSSEYGPLDFDMLSSLKDLETYLLSPESLSTVERGASCSETSVITSVDGGVPESFFDSKSVSEDVALAGKSLRQNRYSVSKSFKDDGFSWTKYGQKTIPGAKYPRSYYRCTYRNLEGCLAAKKVQRSEEEMDVFVVTYRGEHTCNIARTTQPLFPYPSKPEIQQQISSSSCSSSITFSGPATPQEIIECDDHLDTSQEPTAVIPSFNSLIQTTTSNRSSSSSVNEHHHHHHHHHHQYNNDFRVVFSPSFESLSTSAAGDFFFGDGHDSYGNPDSQLSNIINGDRGIRISTGADEDFVNCRRLATFHLKTVDLLLLLIPSRSTALNLRAECLVKVYLPGSKDALVQDLVNLKQLDLSCSSFTRMPDLSRARKLQSLDLHNCNNLVDVSVIQYLTKLEYINLKGCTSLMRLPSLMALKLLLSLDLSDCINLRGLPPSLGCLSSLAALDLSNCKRIQNLPKGILRLKSVQTLSISGCSMLMEQASGPDGMLIENQVNPGAHSSSHASDEEVSISYLPVDKYVPKIPLQQPEEERIISKYNSVASKDAAEPSSTTQDLELHNEVLKAYMNMPVEKIHQANAFYYVQTTVDSLIRRSPNLNESTSLHDLMYCLEELQENVPETMSCMDDARVSKASIQVTLAHLHSSFVQSEGHYNRLAARLAVISDEEEDLDAEIDRLLAKRRELLD